MLYCSTDRLCRRGAPMNNLSHSARPSSSNCSSADRPICGARCSNAAEWPDIQACTTSPFSSPAIGKARLSTPSCLRSTAWVGAALAGVIPPGNYLVGNGRKAIAAFVRKAGMPFRAGPSPGKPTPEVPHLHIAYHGRLKQSARPVQRRRHKEPTQLSRMAARSRSLGRPTRSANLDQKRHRKWAPPQL